MNYYKYKIKKTFLKLIFKIPAVKAWYVGREFLKNPPSVSVKEGTNIDSMVFVNTSLNLKNDHIVSNCVFTDTLEFGEYL